MSTDALTAGGIALAILVIFLAFLLARRWPMPEPPSIASVDRRLSAIETKVATNEREMRTVLQRLEGLPSKETVHAMELKLAELSGEFKGVIQSQMATSHAVQRVEAFLMQATANSIAGSRTEAP